MDKDLKKIREYTRQQINVSTFTNFDDIQKGDNLAWEFSIGDNKMTFNKKGSDLKGLLMSKRFKIIANIEHYKNELDVIDNELQSEGKEIDDSYNVWQVGDIDPIQQKHHSIKHKIESCDRDLGVVDTMLENVVDSKTYTLTVKQLSALK